jgi:hypothetical protein
MAKKAFVNYLTIRSYDYQPKQKAMLSYLIRNINTPAPFFFTPWPQISSKGLSYRTLRRNRTTIGCLQYSNKIIGPIEILKLLKD